MIQTLAPTNGKANGAQARAERATIWWPRACA